MRFSIPVLLVTFFHSHNKVAVASRCQCSRRVAALFELLGLREERVVALCNGRRWLGGGCFGRAFRGGAAVVRSDVDLL